MIDFEKSIFDYRKSLGRPLLAAHRGICTANVPCNSIAAFKIALSEGADVVEIDVSKSTDGVYYVFHPGMEPRFLKSERRISEMTSAEVEAMRLVNQDGVPTSYRVPHLDEVFDLLRGKVYINVDKFPSDIEGISREIRRAGVEKQVIVKTGTEEKYLRAVEEYAPDFMFTVMAWHKDEVTDYLLSRKLNYVGIEALFDAESDPICSDEYIRAMHDRGLLLWSNSIVYDEKAVISAHHTDDVSLTDDPAKGWGWLRDKGFDFIQTDWLLNAKQYLEK